MLIFLPILLLLWFSFRGGDPLGLALIAAGLVVEVFLVLRIMTASTGGVGGHAEWVRDVSERPRLRRHPLWFWATGLVVVGAVVAFFR